MCGAIFLAGSVLLGGGVREKMDALCAERVFGETAKGPVYEEAVKAFRTHYDDTRTPDQEDHWTPGKGLWQGEYWGKSMLSAAVVAEHFDNAAMKAWLKEKALAFVREFQRADGYLASYRNPNFFGGPIPGQPGKEVFSWNLWGRKYTMWALLEISRIAESPELLAAASRMMDHWIAQLSETGVSIENTGYFVGLPSMSVLKPLLLLYGRTGKAAYLDYADSIVAAWEREGNPAPNLLTNAFGEKPVHEWYVNPAWWAKAYEMMSCLEGLVEYARVRSKPRVLEAVRRIVAKLEAHELNAVGCVGFFDHFTNAAACPNATTEPCDVTHWIRVNRELFLATGESHYLDSLEFAFYNAFLAGVYRDGKWGAHSVRSHGTRHRTAPHQVGMNYHQCCIDNMPRTFVDFADTVLSRGGDGALSVNLYTDAQGWEGADEVRITGGYPFGREVCVTIVSRDGGKVRFRNPKWFEGLALNGKSVSGDWAEATLLRGKNEFRLVFERRVRIVDPSSVVGGEARAEGFEVTRENPEMKGLSRVKPGARLFYGPLLLARAKRLGLAREEVLGGDGSIAHRGFSCTLKDLACDGVAGAWQAEFANGETRVVTKVCDFASAADADDPTNYFSIWF